MPCLNTVHFAALGVRLLFQLLWELGAGWGWMSLEGDVPRRFSRGLHRPLSTCFVCSFVRLFWPVLFEATVRPLAKKARTVPLTPARQTEESSFYYCIIIYYSTMSLHNSGITSFEHTKQIMTDDWSSEDRSLIPSRSREWVMLFCNTESEGKKSADRNLLCVVVSGCNRL